MNPTKTRCLIIGSGPAGYTAAIYASRANMNPILYEGMQRGGQLTITSMVENFPGYPEGRMGGDIMEDIRQQALRFGAEIREGEILSVDFSKRPFRCTADDGTQIEAETVIIATGASARWLGLPSEKEYNGSGVSTCATCDGFFYKGKDVAVIGGGDTAAEDATYLAGLCRKVYMVHRRDQLRASQFMQEKVFATNNIEMVWNHIPLEILGEGDKFSKSVTGLRLQNVQTKAEQTLAVDGVFVAIGHQPNTAFLKGQVELDEQGYIKVDNPSSATNIPGVFAAGDVCDPNYRQAIVAAGKGCVAGMDVERFLQSN